MPTSRLEVVRQQIKAAFADAVYPGDENIGYNPDDWESAELSRAFKGKHWSELSHEEVQYHGYSFLSTEGFRFYLPAYLLAALDDYGNRMSMVVYGLIPSDDFPREKRELRDWELDRFDGLTASQKNAVREFLEYARDEALDFVSPWGRSTDLALERYWGRDWDVRDKTLRTSSPRLDALRQQIKAAFADAVYPGDDNIGDNPALPESARLSQDFKRKHWLELSYQELQSHDSSCLSPEGFQYYLPAYLLAALDDYGTLMPRVVYGVNPPAHHLSSSLFGDWYIKRFEGLTAAQKSAVRAFLEYARDEATYYFPQGKQPTLALERYWGREWVPSK